MAEPILSFVHPDDVKATEERIAKYSQAGGGPVASAENRYRTRDGSYRWLQWSVVPEDGVFYNIARDITERKEEAIEREQTDATMRIVIESVSDGLLIVDSSGLLAFVNHPGVVMLGYKSADELIGLGAHATIHHSHLDGSPYASEDCLLEKVSETGRPAHVHEETYWRKDGTAFSVSSSTFPITFRGDAAKLGVFRDVSASRAERERTRGDRSST